MYSPTACTVELQVVQVRSAFIPALHRALLSVAVAAHFATQPPAPQFSLRSCAFSLPTAQLQSQQLVSPMMLIELAHSAAGLVEASRGFLLGKHWDGEVERCA